MNEPERQIMSLFGEAVEHGSPEERAAFLDRACAGDAGRRARLEELFQAYQAAGNFLQGSPPAFQPVATVDESSVHECPRTVIGPYKLLEQIGEGGFGLVFLAEQQEPLRRQVALKVLKPGMDTRQVVARFEAERQALALMDHPHIAKVFDGGATPSGRPFFVMELVKGVPITQFCDQNQLTPRRRLELFINVCQAVQHAHQKGIIHRDLKPSNVLVSRHDTTPTVKVIDFGVAKALGQNLTDKTLFTGVAQMIGTPLYMSPEQAGMSDLDVDTRSDIYSLGVLLYELLTGTTPFTKERFKQAAYDEIRRIIREEEPPKPSTRLSDLSRSGEPSRTAGTPDPARLAGPTSSLASVSALRHTEPAKLTKLVRGELDWIVMKALEKDRNRRYETANGLATDLLRYLHDEPVLACPPSVGYRFRKFARRNRAGLGFAGLILFFLVCLGGGVGWMMRDRAARLSLIEREVSLALGEATALQGLDKWPEALEATKRAQGILAGGGSEGLRERVRELRKDLEMVLRLEEIRLRHLDAPVEDAAYTEAFREYGLDVAALQPTAMADYIRARPIHKDLTVALDFWAYDRRATRTPDDVSWKRLLAVSRAADPDELRNQIREAVEHNDAQALARMVAVLKGSEQPVQTISLLAKALISPEDGAAILRPAQQKYPDDYHINFQLGWVLERIPRQELDEAMRFYTAAVALRPRNAPARFCLGHVLDHLGKRAEAMVEFRKAVEIQPNYALAHYRIGNLLHRQGELEQAVAAYGKAIEYEPAFASARNRRGQAYAALGDWTKAAADLAPKTESGMPSDCWVQVACLRLLQSDVKAYQQLCGQVPQHVEPTTDPVEGMYQASRICTLSANGSVAAPRVVGWAEQAVAAAKTPPRQHVASRLHVLGLAHYRTGQFEQAEHCCRESLEFDPNWPGRILNWLVLAMAHQRLGHADEARTWLAKAVQWRDGLTIGGDKRVAVCPRGLYLTDWLEFHVLLPEAHALGEGKAEK